MKYDKYEIGQRIKAIRKDLGISQDELGMIAKPMTTKAGEPTGAKRQTVANWESGQTLPPLEVLLNICNEAQCELGYILCEEGYEGKTRTTTDICMETGLSVEAVEELHSVKERFEKHSNHLDVSFPIKIELVNYLILNINEIVESIDLLHLLQNNRKRLKEQYNYSFFRDLFVESLRAGDEAEAYFYDLLHDELYKKYEENEEKTYSELEQFKNQNLFDAFKKDNSLDFELWKLNKEILKLIETFIEERQV